MNEFFINKVEETIAEFKQPKILAIEILKKLILRPRTKFKVRETTVAKNKGKY